MSEISEGDLMEAVTNALYEGSLIVFRVFIQMLKEKKFPKAELDQWQGHFDEYMRVQQEVDAELGASSRLADVERRIPNNKWIPMMKFICKQFPRGDSSKSSPQACQELEDWVKSKRNRKVN